ncbi:MAG TPA: S24/S26 family peptidase [Thermoanaerobaculia bacterium]|nr:S24/S26 family peptidase [Thermoanaerobaculia bacterium]
MRELAREGPLTLAVRGGSMAPLLADGDRVEVVRALLYWPGDVVAFRAADERLVVHRLLGYRPFRAAGERGRIACVTRGDASFAHDPPVPLARILGRVRGRPELSPPTVRVRSVLAFLGIVARRLAR